MFHDGSTYRQAVGRIGAPDTLYQFGWNGSSYAYGHNSTNVLSIVDSPADAFPGQARILHDGELYRLYRLAP